jgi:uncharacterized protein with PQ loop repeat
MVVFGWIATILSLLYKFPQIVYLYKVKNASGLSLTSMVFQTISYAFYIAHGATIDDMPIITMGAVSCMQSIILIIMYFHYKRLKKKEPEPPQNKMFEVKT